jgi:glutathione S-transferase
MEAAKLYSFELSHPSMAARAMLELKGIEYRTVNVLAGSQRIHLRLAGFRDGTVPALKLDGRRVQGSLRISRALEQLRPQPPLFPGDPELRRGVEEAERWGDEDFQSLPRVCLRWALVRDRALREWLAEESGLPAPAITARTSGPLARYYARVINADEAAVRRTLREMPDMLDRVDALLDDGTLGLDPPNAAALQILCTVRALDAFSDFHDLVSAHPAAAAARQLFPRYPEPIPRFLPPDLAARLGR